MFEAVINAVHRAAPIGPNQQGKPGQQGQGQGDMNDLDRAGEAMGEAESSLGEGNVDSAVGSQGRALDALRKGAQGLAQSMQQQMGQGLGPGRSGRLGQPRAQQETDPLGRPLRGRDYGDDYTVNPARSTCSARAPHDRGTAPPLRRRAAPAGGARLHRAALEGLLSNATSRTSSRAPARLPASEILLLGGGVLQQVQASVQAAQLRLRGGLNCAECRHI